MMLRPLPPPQFPTQFGGTSDARQQKDVAPAQVDWPTEEREAVSERAIEWGIKTQGEQHLDRLEARLAQLQADGVTVATPADRVPPLAASARLYDQDGSSDVEEVQTETEAEAEGAAIGDEGEEGRALLSAVADPSGHIEAAQQAPQECVACRDAEEESARALAKVDAAQDEEDLDKQVTPAVLHRISFRDTVRISGGMRSALRSHRHHRHTDASQHFAPTERTSLLSSQARPISAPSNLLVAAVAPSAGPSRSTSPASRSRRASMSSSYRSGASFAHLHPSSYTLSSSPASYGASRSTSPCSSIYAPLQPPSKFSPNPLWVRTSSQRRELRRTRSGSSLSFQDFLRSGAAYGSPDDDDSDDDEEDRLLASMMMAGSAAAAAAAGELLDPRSCRFGAAHAEYRDLVEAQRARREKWEARRAAKEARARAAEAQARRGARFWDRLAGLLALGMVGSGPARAGGGMVGHTPNSGIGRGGPRPTTRGRGRSPARPSPLRRGSSARTPSALSVESSASAPSSSPSDPDGDSNGLPWPPLPRRQRDGVQLRPSRPPVVKTEMDVRFGPAPARYFRLDWWRFKLAQLVLAAREALRMALVGFERQRTSTRQAGYEEV